MVSNVLQCQASLLATHNTNVSEGGSEHLNTKLLQFRYAVVNQPLTTSPLVSPVQIGSTYEYYMAFTSTSLYTVTFTRPVVSQLFMIGGGGAGGHVITGGGGAGAYYHNTSFAFNSGTYTFKVGAGGAGGNQGSVGTNGADTYIQQSGSDVLVNGLSLRCKGGGRGGAGWTSSGDLPSTSWDGSSGGCGGGGTGFFYTYDDRNTLGGSASNAGTVGTGTAGGAGRQKRADNCLASGGGGGIGEAGESFNNLREAGNGGHGLTITIKGFQEAYGGGGGGGEWAYSPSPTPNMPMGLG
jgi:hypothetical protein